MEKKIEVTPPKTIPFSQADISTRYEDVYQDIVPDEVANVRWGQGAYEFVCQNGVCLRIQVLSPAVIRFRYSPDGNWERDFSYAVQPDFAPQRVAVSLDENKNEYILLSEQLQVVVTKSGLKVRVYDLDDRVVCEDEGGYSARRTVMQGWSEVRLSKKCHRKTLFYGLGDKTASGANLHGKKFENWCTDSFAFGEDTDPLYRAVPFFYALYQSVAHGIFLDNTYRTHIDFNSKDEGELELRADGGEMNYYFIYGPKMLSVAQQYHALTGTHALPPIWALGYHQCRWSYYPESQVMELAAIFRKEQIPCDAIYLDIDYMDGYRCFTWDDNHFPDPVRMIRQLEAEHFHTVVMIDPGLKEDPAYEVYQQGLAGNHFVMNPDGDVTKAPVWPGFCAFPDYTRPETRAWWGELYRKLYCEQGVSGFWNDMNEPAVFHVLNKTLPDHVRHDYDGAPCSHNKAHNIYGQQMARASWEGLAALQPQKRPYLLTRATYSGGQRYSAVWTGDNCADWDHLQMANVQCQRLAISGFSFCGTDLGGFAGEPDGELYTRWLQLSVFHPLMRTHSMGEHATGDGIAPEEVEVVEANTEKTTFQSGLIASEASKLKSEQANLFEEVQPTEDRYGGWNQEPWSFGEKWTPIARKAIELRYCILPVLYTAMWRNSQFGTPVLQHPVFADESDPKLWDQDRDFLFGEHLFVSPVVQSKVQRQMVYLPKGNWYYFWTGQSYNGEVFINVMQQEIPFFVREGGVLPIYPVRQSTQELVDELTLYVYYKNGTEQSVLYEDAGEGYEYQQDQFAIQSFEVKGSGTDLVLNRSVLGKYGFSYTQIRLYLVGFPTFVRRCEVDGSEMPIKEIRLKDRSLYTLTLTTEFKIVKWQA